MAFRRCLILPPHTTLITDSSVSPRGCLSLRHWAAGGRVEVHPASLQLQHRAGGRWSPVTPNLAQGDGGVPGLSFNGACNWKNGGERNTIKRKRVFPSRGGGE